MLTIASRSICRLKKYRYISNIDIPFLYARMCICVCVCVCVCMCMCMCVHVVCEPTSMFSHGAVLASLC